MYIQQEAFCNETSTQVNSMTLEQVPKDRLNIEKILLLGRLYRERNAKNKNTQRQRPSYFIIFN